MFNLVERISRNKSDFYDKIIKEIIIKTIFKQNNPFDYLIFIQSTEMVECSVVRQLFNIIKNIKNVFQFE